MPLIKCFFLMMLLALPITALAQTDSPDLTPPEKGSFDPASVTDIDLNEYAIVPEVTDHARLIYTAGQVAGQNQDVFSKVGDCMSETQYFMVPFSTDDYDLGDYQALAATIGYFSATPVRDEFTAFSAPSLAAASGFNSASVLDGIWSDPTVCDLDESPLACEYRLSNPAFSVIMFGTNDLFFISEADFDYYMRQIVLETIESNIVPILSTFPTRLEDPEKSVFYNQIIVGIARDYDLPLINLWSAVEPLDNRGIDPIDPTHLSIPESGSTGILDDENLAYGYTTRNLITLQALASLRQGLAGEDES